ncbi:1-deoxy-D-xylulose-5-phosphate synthase [Croceiramulus getboli]|nr:1-deoxy-D-xylulose-5-phosphate synthase [Flavobacteriaceae bacterium YJPT1-3]
MKTKLLQQIQSPEDLRFLSLEELQQLAQEAREFIIQIVAAKEGHLGASLGVTELTLALHYVFQTPQDFLLWDVGHQAYIHKILTGRRDQFGTNRQYGGLSGFPKRSESEYDPFGTGHSSTSISAALGMAMAAQMDGNQDRQHIAVIGDASIASGMAFEGLNHAGVTNANLLIVLNDNAIGIDPSVGALKKYLTNVKKGTAREENLFEALHLHYEGPIDGHDLPLLVETLQKLSKLKGPRLLHVVTTKGKGLAQAEADQVRYHAPGKFNAQTGDLEVQEAKVQPPKFQDVFGLSLVELARDNQNIVGITPAMPTGSSLKYMMEAFPERAFDVGIAEQHAVTFAAGLATQGKIVFCAIYSTFLQRAYDQLIHDVGLQELPVIFCIDRAGLVGQDGPTHHGAFDLAYLNCIPNLSIAVPQDEMELRNLMFTASLQLKGPLAIRYPRGRGQQIDWQLPFEKISMQGGRQLRKGEKIAVLGLGPLLHSAAQAIERTQVNAGLYDFRFLKPLDTALLDQLFEQYDHLITLEDGCKLGGFGQQVRDYAFAPSLAAGRKAYSGSITVLGLPDQFIEHGTIAELHEAYGLSVDHIAGHLKRLSRDL